MDINLIPLNLFGDKALNILEALRIYKLRSGTRKNHVSWGGELCHFVTTPNGEVCIWINTKQYGYRHSHWSTKSTAEERKQFLISRLYRILVEEEDWMIRMMASQYTREKSLSRYIGITNQLLDNYSKCEPSVFKKYLVNPNNGCALRINSYTFDYTPDPYSTVQVIDQVEFSELKLIVDTLIGRKRAGKNMSDEEKNKIIGQKRDPLTTELEAARREEFNQLKIAMDNEYKAADKWFTVELKKAEQDLRTKLAEMQVKIAEKYKEKTAALMNLMPMSF